MIEVAQDRFGKPEGNCYEACIASLLEVPLSEVPYVRSSHPGRLDALNQFISERGHISCYSPISTSGRPREGYYILHGVNPRGVGHSVIALLDEVIWDPNRQHADGLATVDAWEVLLPMSLYGGRIPVGDEPEEDLAGWATKNA